MKSQRRELRQLFMHVGAESIIGVALMMYLLINKDFVTPDFFHFVVCLGEDATHSLWCFFLWFTFKCYFIRKVSDDERLPENSRILLIII